MMSVFEYAEDMNKTVSEILKKCKELGIDAYEEEDMLDDEAITLLDNVFANEEETTYEENLEDIEVVVDNQVIDNDKVINKQKLKKKTDNAKKTNVNAKKEFANKKKEMYKNKEKLMSNTSTLNENIIVYKENMTVSELASLLNVSGTELVKKLFSLGVMATLNNSISYENAEILVLDYGKELKSEETTSVVNFEKAELMMPDSDVEPEIFEEFKKILPEAEFVTLGRYDYYDACCESQVKLAILSGESRIYANILLTIGVA
jgi:hypothetical protein